MIAVFEIFMLSKLLDGDFISLIAAWLFPISQGYQPPTPNEETLEMPYLMQFVFLA